MKAKEKELKTKVGELKKELKGDGDGGGGDDGDEQNGSNNDEEINKLKSENNQLKHDINVLEEESNATQQQLAQVQEMNSNLEHEYEAKETHYKEENDKLKSKLDEQIKNGDVLLVTEITSLKEEVETVKDDMRKATTSEKVPSERILERSEATSCSNTRRDNHAAYSNAALSVWCLFKARFDRSKFVLQCVDFWAPYEIARNDDEMSPYLLLLDLIIRVRRK